MTSLADLSVATQLREQRRPSKPESLVVELGEFEVVARIGAKVVARAYRTGWGWHVPLPRRVRHDGGMLERAWASCATRVGAELALTRFVLFGATT